MSQRSPLLRPDGNSISTFDSGSIQSLDGGRTPLDGSWEQKGRTPGSAAVVALLGIGFLYFNAQTLLVILAMLSPFSTLDRSMADANFADQMTNALQLNANPIRTAIVLSQYLFMLLPAWLLARSWHSSSVERYLRLRRASLGEVSLAVLLALAFIPAGTFIANETSRFVDAPEWLEQMTAVLFTADSAGEFVWLVFVVALTPAFCEEVFFRGFVQRTLERTIGWKSVIVVGVLFGLFHMQPLGLVTLSMLGIIIGYLFYRSRSLLPAIAAHFTNNFVAILALYLHPTIGGVDLATADRIPLSWVLGSLPVVVLIFLLYHRITAVNFRGMPADTPQ